MKTLERRGNDIVEDKTHGEREIVDFPDNPRSQNSWPYIDHK